MKTPSNFTTADNNQFDSAAQHLATLNEDLAVVRARVRSVACGLTTGFYLYGRPGTSKSYTVMKTLEDEGTVHYYHAGFLTPVGLFDLIDERSSQVIVLDDVSQMLSDKKAVQLLLAALGTQQDDRKARAVRYKRNGKDKTVFFTGGIICISNLELGATPLLQALKSRVHYLKQDPSDEQLSALMLEISKKGWRSKNDDLMAPEECLAVASFVLSQFKRLGTRLDIRVLVDKSFPDYVLCRNGDADAHWMDLVRATMEEQMVALEHTSAAHLTRDEEMARDRAIASEIAATYPTRGERVAEWDARTGKSKRALYRRLKEVLTL